MLGWIGTASSIIGSFAVAFGLMVLGYSTFLVGCISWLIVAMKQRNASLATLNGFFLLANLIGFFRNI